MLSRFRDQYNGSNMLTRIIAVNAVVFLIISATYILPDLFRVSGLRDPSTGMYRLVYWLSVPSDLSVLILRPWTLITYMFVHQGFWHLIFNMLMLYFSGRIFCDMLNYRRLLPTYILGGLAGVIFFIAGYNLFPKFYLFQGSFMHGASAGVMAVFVATATYFPTFEVYLFGILRIQMRWLAAVYVLSDFVALGGQSNLGGHLAHLGGALYGFIYARQLAAGNDFSTFFYSLTDKLSGLFRRKSNIRVSHRGAGNNRPARQSREKSIDEILDKISRSGYDSLNKEEKEILFKASKEQ